MFKLKNAIQFHKTAFSLEECFDVVFEATADPNQMVLIRVGHRIHGGDLKRCLPWSCAAPVSGKFNSGEGSEHRINRQKFSNKKYKNDIFKDGRTKINVSILFPSSQNIKKHNPESKGTQNWMMTKSTNQETNCALSL